MDSFKYLKHLPALLETIVAATAGCADAEYFHSYATAMGYGDGTVEEWQECLKRAILAGLVEKRETDCVNTEIILNGGTREQAAVRAECYMLTVEGCMLGGYSYAD